MTIFIILFTYIDFSMKFFPAMNNRLILGLCLSMAILAALVPSAKNNISREHSRFILFYFMFIFIMGLISILYTKNFSMFRIFYITQGFFITFALLKNKLNYKLIKYSTYAIIILFLYFIVSGINANNVFNIGSRNGLTFHSLFMLILYYISIVQNNKKVDIIPSFIGLLISLWATGRSGALAFSFLFIVVILEYIKSDQRKKIKMYSKIVFIILIILLLLYLLLNNNTMRTLFIEPLMKRFENEGFESPRSMMITGYIDEAKSNLLSFLFGAKYINIPIIHYFNNNPHNSFINMHAQFGMIVWLLNLFLIVKTQLNFILTNRYFYFGLFLVILMRIFTDDLAFTELFDGIIYYFIFIGFFQLDKTNTSKSGGQ
ncbi:hypothetical protein [Alkalibaculum bacchi]|nr:hypothetical protein [Alkalibaculum bacchi]